MTQEDRAKPLARQLADWMHDQEPPQDCREKTADVLTAAIAALILEGVLAEREACAAAIRARGASAPR